MKSLFKTKLDSASLKRRQGSSMVELLAAVAIISFMATAIYYAGGAVLRHSQSVTIMTAAHMYAKEGLEELLAAGYDKLTGAEPVEQVIMLNPNTHNVDLTRRGEIIWHAADGSVVSNPVVGGYAELIVEVSWDLPRSDASASTAISTLVF